VGIVVLLATPINTFLIENTSILLAEILKRQCWFLNDGILKELARGNSIGMVVIKRLLG
jgi:hypothetical protein